MSVVIGTTGPYTGDESPRGRSRSPMRERLGRARSTSADAVRRIRSASAERLRQAKALAGRAATKVATTTHHAATAALDKYHAYRQKRANHGGAPANHDGDVPLEQ